MAAARGFQAVRHDGTPFYTYSTGTGVFSNPYKVCFDVAFMSPRTDSDRVLLVEYDTADITSAGGTTKPWLSDGNNRTALVDGIWTYTATGNPVFSQAWAKITAGTTTDELTPDEISHLAANFGDQELASAQAILAGHGWDDWQPARV